MPYQKRDQVGRGNGVDSWSRERAGVGAGAPGKQTLVERLPAQVLARAQSHGGDPASGGADADMPPSGDREFAEQLGSFEEIVASAPGQVVPEDVRMRFEAAHRVELAAVRAHATPAIGDHGLRGLSRGTQIALADLSDRDALEHELGHVVDTLRAGGAPPNTTLDGMPLADDPTREARADELAAAAKSPPPPGHAPGKLLLAELASGRARQPCGETGGAPMPKLTNRADLKCMGGTFDWASHKTKVEEIPGGGYKAEGRGAVLSSATELVHESETEHGQLKYLFLEIPPQYVDDSRPQLGQPSPHFRDHNGAYVLPSALLGLRLPGNLLYLPPAALTTLTEIQRDMIDLAKKGPGRLRVDTEFAPDGLASGVSLTYEALDPNDKSVSVYTIKWEPKLPTDSGKWAAEPAPPVNQGGVKPETAEWKTQITWKSAHVSGDGVHVVADPLGPDHPLGSTPSDKTAKERVNKLHTAAGSKEPYIAGHLLNDHLGGPGDLSANLAPIPKTANAQMSKSIEQPAKEIVNQQRGWIRYEVKVTHNNDNGLDYPKEIEANMGVYDATKTLRNQTTSKIEISQPSSYKTVKCPLVTNGKLGGTALLTSPKMLDEVILDHETDLRPFLKGSTELFDLITGLELNPSIGDPKFVEAWCKIQEDLHKLETKILPELNILSTVTEALGVWTSDPFARQYLAIKTVKQLKQSMEYALLESESFAKNATGYLAKATAAVKKISLSDMFRDQRLLQLAQVLIKETPDDRSLLQVVQAQQAQRLPLRFDQLQKARNSGANTMELEKFRTDYKKQPQPTHIDYSLSPGRFYEDFDTSVEDVMKTAMYGAKFESVRGPKVIEKLRELAFTGEATILATLLKDPLLGPSKRIQAMVGQLLAFMTRSWPEPADMARELKNFFYYNEVPWQDSLAILGTQEPQVALQLYKMLGIT